MPKSSVSLRLTDQEDARTLRRWTRSTSIRAGLVHASPDRAPGRRRQDQHRDRDHRWLLASGRDPLAQPLCHPRLGRSGRPAALLAGHGTIGEDRRAEIVAATLAGPPERPWRHPLVDPDPRRPPQGQPHDRRSGVGRP